MATESIHVSALIPASPQAVYDAWLSSQTHAAMTGGGASIEPHVGGAHAAWDGYIGGKTLELDPGRRIVQSWRTTQFPEDAGDSRIVITLEEEGGHTRMQIAHSDIPEGQGADYQSGWDKFYFGPMAAYFGAQAPAPAEAAPKRAARKGAAKKTARKAPKKGAAKKAAAKKGAAKKGAAKKGAAKKGAAKKAAAKKGAAKKAAAKKTAKKGAAKKAAGKSAKKAAPRKAASRKRAAKKATPRKAN